MAIYHFSAKAISRSGGRSATAASAYRSASKVVDERTGEIFDYSKKRGVVSADIVMPDDCHEAHSWAFDNSALWNMAEKAEKRKDACVAKEYVVALPAELDIDQHRELVLGFAKEMANREGCGVEVCIHQPNRSGSDKNWHAHIMKTTRKVTPDGLGEKLDSEKSGRNRADDLKLLRKRWADLTNEKLQDIGMPQRISEKTLEAQGIDRKPTKHLGVGAVGYERRTGKVSEKRKSLAEREISEKLLEAKRLGVVDKLLESTQKNIIDTSMTIQDALRERDQGRSEKNLGVNFFDKEKLLGKVRDELKRVAEAAPAKPAKPELEPVKNGRYSGVIVLVSDSLVKQDHGREYVNHKAEAFPSPPKVGQYLSIQYGQNMNITQIIDKNVKKDRGLGF